MVLVVVVVVVDVVVVVVVVVVNTCTYMRITYRCLAPISRDGDPLITCWSAKSRDVRARNVIVTTG